MYVYTVYIYANIYISIQDNHSSIKVLCNRLNAFSIS